MSRAFVQYQERDLSAYVSSNSTIGTAMILPFNKGKRDQVLQFTTAEQVLSALTPNNAIEIGMNLSILSAMRVAKKSTLYAVVPKTNGCAFSGILLSNSTAPKIPADKEVKDVEAFDFTTHGTSSVLLAAQSQGVWGNKLKVSVINYKEPDKIIAVADKTGPTATKSFSLTQEWGIGYPVTVYGPSLPVELDSNTVYFLGRGATDTEDKKYMLYATQADAVKATTPIALKTLPIGTIISPYIQYTKIKGTSVIRVFNESNLNTPIGEYIVSTDHNKRSPDGDNLFIEEVLSGTDHIEAIVNPGVGKGELFEFLVPVSLGGGSDGDAVTTGDMIKAVRFLQSTNDVNIKLVLDGGYTVVAFQRRLEQLCRDRGDCVPILSAPISAQKSALTSAQEVVNFRRYDLNLDSSWATLYAPHVKVYDEFNDREVWASPDGLVAEAILDTAANYEIFYPVAGNKRGMLDVLDTKVHYTDGDQDLLYDNGINPIIFSAGKGIKIWGQKTLKSQPSMLDRLNVRMLMITIGPAIVDLLQSYLFDFNDPATRAEAKSKVDDYMETVQAKRGVKFFTVICDESNNTPNDVDNHILNLWLVICPNNSIEKIVFPIAVTNNSAKLENVYQQL